MNQTWLNILFLTLGLLGHAALAVSMVNVVFGSGLPCRINHWVYRLHVGLIVIVGPLLAWLTAIGFGALAGRSWLSLPPPLLAYWATCWLAFLGFGPWHVIRRLRRPVPAAQVSNHARVVDVAAEAGDRLFDRVGKWPWALVPGNDQFRIELREKVYRLPRVPAAWDGLSILHLTDFHLTGTVRKAFYHRAIELANELDCDLVAFTGDLLDRDAVWDWIDEVFRPLRARAGKYAILGNHDLYDQDRCRAPGKERFVRRALERAGFHLVTGRSETIDLRGHPLVIAGDEGPWGPVAPALDGVPPQAFRLLLAHAPDRVGWASRQGFDLMLAGHNHGGQVRLPVLGPIYMPSVTGRRYECGGFQVGPTLMYVGRGLSGIHPFRFQCLPEITRIVLHRWDEQTAGHRSNRSADNLSRGPRFPRFALLPRRCHPCGSGGAWG